jgi:hypothetical protein
MVSLDWRDLIPSKSYDHLKVGQYPLIWAMTSLTKPRGYGEEDKNEFQEGYFEIALLGLQSWV